jgi:hypothetical protein
MNRVKRRGSEWNLRGFAGRAGVLFPEKTLIVAGYVKIYSIDSVAGQDQK